MCYSSNTKWDFNTKNIVAIVIQTNEKSLSSMIIFLHFLSSTKNQFGLANCLLSIRITCMFSCCAIAAVSNAAEASVHVCESVLFSVLTIRLLLCSEMECNKKIIASSRRPKKRERMEIQINKHNKCVNEM